MAIKLVASFRRHVPLSFHLSLAGTVSVLIGIVGQGAEKATARDETGTHRSDESAPGHGGVGEEVAAQRAPRKATIGFATSKPPSRIGRSAE